MTSDIDTFAFYIVTENDDLGETAHGPYTMIEAESIVQVDEHIITGKHLATLHERILPSNHNDKSSTHTNAYEQNKMLQELKRWAFFLIFIGVIQIFISSHLSNTWGLLLIVVGLSSFYFKSPTMFVIYGTNLLWASISNALSGAGGWVAFSVLQAFFAFQTFRQFFLFRKATSQTLKNENDEQFRDKAVTLFPWISFGVGLLSFMGLVIVFLGIILFTTIDNTSNGSMISVFDFIGGLVIDGALIGFATGLGSILSKYEYKLFSIAGMVASAIVLLIELGLGLTT